MFELALPPHRLSGSVYGALLNHAPQLAALGDAAHQAPHKAPPRAPVLQVKPRNTLVGQGAAVVVPAGVAALEVGATLAVVIGSVARRVAEGDALRHVAGYMVAMDLCVPHASHYRPAARERARDGFCPLGTAQMVPASAVPQPDTLRVLVFIDDVLVHDTDSAQRVRGVARLICDVSEFMTLHAGDVLLLGAAHGAPLARAGQSVAVAIEGIGRLSIQLFAEQVAS